MHTYTRPLLLVALLALSFTAAATPPRGAPAGDVSLSWENPVEAEAAAEASASARQSQQLEASQEQVNEQRSRQETYLDSSYADESVQLYAPSVIPPECGVGGNAGGSRSGDSAFLGVAWTTERCYSFRAAAVWAQLGAIDLACEMLADATRQQLKRRGITRLDCGKVAGRLRAMAAISAPPVEKEAISREEVVEIVNRAFKASQSK